MKKKLWLAALLLVSTFSILLAQGPQRLPPEERAKRTVERLKPVLTLTDQQEKEVLPVFTEFFGSMGKLMQAGRPSREDRQKLSAERDDKLKKVLTADQMKKLADAEQKMREQRREGGGQQ